MKRFVIILSLILGISQAQDLPLTQKKDLDILVQEQVNEGSPGLAVGVVRKGEIIYEAYAGLADIPNKIPITASTRFNIASNAKQFTALCILQLVEAGNLSLNDDIRTYLPELFPAIQKTIRISHLLNHSSGIRDVYNLWGLQGIVWWKKTLNNQDALNLLTKQKELNFEPGTRHFYSNSNYILLAEIIKVVSKKSLDEYADELFLQLNMPETSFEANHKNIDKYALPYGGWKKWQEYPWLNDIYGDGALFSTLQDQLTWEGIVQVKKTRILSTEQLTLSQQPIANTSISEYGYGVEFGTYRGLPYTFHEGSTGAWNASSIRFPSENLAIVVLSNSGKISPYQVSRACADVLIPSSKLTVDKHLRSPTASAPYISPKDLVGTYKTPGGYFFRFVLKNEKLYMERYGREAIELEHEKDQVYHQVTDPDWKQAFIKDPVAGLQVTAYYPSHDPYTLTRIATDWEAYDFASINGTYVNKETEVEFKLSYKKEDIYTFRIRGDTHDAQLYAPDFLLMGGYTVEVRRNDAGIVRDLLLNTERVKNLRFQLKKR